MGNSSKSPQPNAASVLWHSLLARFSLLDDKAEDGMIDESLRNGIELRGATPWILIFAIFIASIGLNVNSTAVIIGAMLISPLMGPIMGIGYGIAIYDFAFIRRSFLNLGIAAVISLITSTLYFAVTPLTEAHSELLARTSPTIWDVLIALFGGFAGIIGVTRKEKSNVIPGVAIATALMPPLCTAGYGLAHGNWGYFLGAIYLFSINCVYIAVAAVVVVGFLNPPHKKFVDPKIEERVKRALMAVVLLTALPSVYLAYRLVGNEVFHNKATQFVRSEFAFPKSHVIEIGITPKNKHIEVTLIGDRLKTKTIEEIKTHLSPKGLPGAILTVHQSGDANLDVNVLREGIMKELSSKELEVVVAKDQQIAQLQQQVVWSDQSNQLASELKAQFPALTDIVIGEGVRIAPPQAPETEAAVSSVSSQAEPEPSAKVPVLIAKSPRRLSRQDTERLERWFRARTQTDDARIAIN
ncbi:hypothetical protein AEAC466_12020 [Asticcacaulis sp. AC466]|nr:hypothetical protein AEAC466_12020 [Asticcacaulis sp. AC466]